MTFVQALEYIEEDELVEATPANIRLRKELLTENARKKAGRSKATEVWMCSFRRSQDPLVQYYHGGHHILRSAG